MIYTLGVDVGFSSSPTGCALLWFNGEPRLLETFSIRPRCGGGWQERQYDILHQLDNRLWALLRNIPSADLLIGYACAHYQKNQQTALTLSELCGGVRGLAVAHGLACVGVQETESKIALTGERQASKADMIAAALRIFGKLLSEHEADGAAHALAAEATWRRARVVREAIG